jgi:hypothetical protein
MKFICKNCKNEFDEVEYMEYKHLPRFDEYCPKCYPKFSISMKVWKAEKGDCVIYNIDLSEWVQKFPCNQCLHHMEITHDHDYVQIVCPNAGFRAIGDLSDCPFIAEGIQ